MEKEKQKAEDQPLEVEQGEISIQTDNPKSETISFKKPILVGKIGRLPKKVESLPSKSKISTQTVEVANETDDTQQNEPKQTLKVDTVNQKIDSFTLQYKEPSWSGLPKTEYNFEVLKDGAIIETINLFHKPYWIFGRLANCDMAMHHPTISRYHAVLQYRSEPSEKEDSGFYVYDLGSTHGTYLNKNRLRPRVYVRIQVGHMLKLGCSTRSYLLNGPEEDAEIESDLSVTELKQKRQELLERMEDEKRERLLKTQKEEEERRKRDEERGIDWGMGEDADEDTDLSENPYAQTTNEELYLDDPKKTLRGYFEREGLELEYDCSEQGMGQFLCKVELPIDDERGRPMYAEVLHKGKKKDAVVQCALEACRVLDRHGLLRQAVHESRKRKAKNWAENDYYDSDDDTFLDRTGTIEKKREKRMIAKNPHKAETYESLLEKEQKLNHSINTMEKQLMEAQEKMTSANNCVSEEDSLDAFMKDLKDSKPDKIVINKLKNELTKLKLEHAKVIKLVNIARPASLPPLIPQYATDNNKNNAGRSKVMPIFGKRKKIPISVSQKQEAIIEPKISEAAEDEEEEEEEDERKKEEVSSTRKCESIQFSADIDNQKIENPNAVNNRLKLKKTNCDSGTKKEEKITCENFEKSMIDQCQRLLDDVPFKFKKISSKIVRMDLPEEKYRSLILTIMEEAKNMLVEMNKMIDEESQASEVETATAEMPSSTSDINETLEKSDDLIDQGIKKKKNQRRIQQRLEKVEIDKQKGYMEDAQKEDYNMWLPPSNQKGDGRTKLNEKYGY